jgi:long-chain acyl-CoA synthetase
MNSKDLFGLMQNNNTNFVEYFDSKNKIQKKTYSAMYKDIIAICNYLNQEKLKKNSKIGALSRNRYEFVVLDLACILAGFHFISFHFEDFKDKIHEVYNSFNLDLLIVEDSLLSGINPEDNIISINELNNQLDKAGISNLDETRSITFCDEDIFTTIFTSGSTGTPKGIEVKFKSVNHFIKECINKFNLNVDDKTILFLPLSQYSSRCYVYSAIAVGFNIAISTTDKLLFALKYFKPTVFQGVPYFFESIFDNFISQIEVSITKRVAFKLYVFFNGIFPLNLISGKLQKKLFKEIYDFFGGKLRFMITGAAPIRKEVLHFFKNIGLPLFESYGLIETGVITLSYPGHQKIGSVGKVLDDKEISFDSDQQIIVSSSYLWGSKYLNSSDEENARVFFKDGYIATGDVGYLDKDGYLYLSGRIKEVIILSNGTKIHPNLIEKELNSSSLIKQSAVFGDNKPSLSCVIVKSSKTITDEEISEEINRINKRLSASQQIKKYVIATEDFSNQNKMITSNMKLDRKRIFQHYKSELE